MQTNTLDRLETLLKQCSKYTAESGEVIKTKVEEDIQTFNQDLLSLLCSDKDIKNAFFTNVNGTLVFDKQSFLWVLNSKDFLPSSYTRFENKIGLGYNSNFISQNKDIQLLFPYKDCVLYGGQTKDEQKREEIFFNTLIGGDHIRRMLEPKMFTNIKKYSNKGVEKVTEFSEQDNLIIKGNNLIALASILQRYKGRVKCIYIDPPYNTGNDSFHYNDRFNHSSWLVFMKNRIELARELLREDGVIFVQCDDNEQAYLKVLMDEVFGRDNHYGTLIQLKGSTQNDAKTIQKNHEYILVYVKEKQDRLLTYTNYVKKKVYEDFYLGRDTGASSGNDTLEDRNELGYTIYYYESTANGATGNNNTLEDRNELGYTSFNFFQKGNKLIHAIALRDYDVSKLTDTSTEEDIYKDDEYLLELGYIKIRPPKRSGNKLGRWTWSIDTFKEYWNNDEVLIKDNKKVIKKNFIKQEDITIIKGIKYYFEKNTLPLQSILNISSNKGTKELKNLFDNKVFNNPKTEELIYSLIKASTQPSDLILDFHLGSGTTAAVAHKMGRRYIGIEQMDYIESVAVERLKKVIEGEQGGVSKSVNWQGGGSFVYCELTEGNKTLIDKVTKANEQNIGRVAQDIFTSEDIVPYLTKEELQNAQADFDTLPLTDKQQVLIDLIDKNRLYVSYSDIDNTDYKLTAEDKKFTQSFYNKAK